MTENQDDSTATSIAAIICPRCSRKHRVDADKLPEDKVVFARCKSCSHRFPVQVDQLRHMAVHSATLVDGDSEARKLCITLSKGGVGKTTTSVNLAAGLALAGYKTLLVDTDTQGQSAYMLGKKPRAGLTELVTGEVTADEAITSARHNLWVLSGGRSLAGMKRVIDKKSFGAEWTLSEAMQSLDKKFDYVIVDTSPGWDQLTVNALFYATEILVPVALEVMPLHGLSEFMQSLNSVQKYRPEVQLRYILPTMMDTRVVQPKHILTELKKLYPEQICDPIGYDENFTNAPSYGQTIFEFAPDCSGAHDYRLLVNRVTGRDNPF